MVLVVLEQSSFNNAQMLFVVLDQIHSPMHKWYWHKMSISNAYMTRAQRVTASIQQCSDSPGNDNKSTFTTPQIALNSATVRTLVVPVQSLYKGGSLWTYDKVR